MTSTRARVLACAVEACPAVQSAVLWIEALSGRKRTRAFDSASSLA